MSGQLLVKQNLSVSVSKAPSTAGAAISNKDFEIDPPEILNISDYSENFGFRYSLADGTVDNSLGMGSVQNGGMLIMQPEHDIKVKLVFGATQTPDITFKANRTSVIHLDGLTDVLLSNDSGLEACGRFFVVGD